MNKQLSTSEFKIESVYVASDLVRAARKRRALRRKLTILLVVGFSMIGFGPYAAFLFKHRETPPRIHYLAISGSQAATQAPARQPDPAVASSQKHIADAQAEMEMAMRRFETDGDAFAAALAGPDAGAGLFADESKASFERSLPPFITFDFFLMHSQP